MKTKIIFACLLFSGLLYSQELQPVTDSLKRVETKLQAVENTDKSLKSNSNSEYDERISRKKYAVLSEYIEDRYFNNGKQTLILSGVSEITESDILDCNIIVIDGILTLKTKLKGSIAAVNSKIYIEESENRPGSVYLLNSSVVPDSGIIISGIEYKDFEDYCVNDWNVINNSNFRFKPAQFRHLGEDFSGGASLRYNRVEGLFFGLKSDKKPYWNGRKSSSFYGSLGYAFGNHRWTGALGYERWIGNEERVTLGAEVHSLTDSKDSWIINDTENSLAAFFLHEDFRDYFLREGFSVYAAKNFSKQLFFDLKYVRDNYRSQSETTDWALFGGDKKFRVNPPVAEGVLNSVIAGGYYNTIDERDYMPNGWKIALNVENGSGEAEYNRAFIDIRRYQDLSNGNHISGRIIAGTADNQLPPQKAFELGGLGTIPAAKFKELSGNRMLLFNVEYSFPLSDLFSDLFDAVDSHKHNTGNLIITYDAGFADNSFSKNPFNGFDFRKDNTRQDIGFAIGLNRNTIRLGAAFRLDRAEPARFILRISRPF